jgi:CubicO group peptidase (beta-lactamase class C family)
MSFLASKSPSVAAVVIVSIRRILCTALVAGLLQPTSLPADPADATGLVAAAKGVDAYAGIAAETARAASFAGVVRDAEAMPRIRSLIVSQCGDIVLERYFNGARADDLVNVKSVSKSILSALTGIAIAQGFLSGVDEPVGRHVGVPGPSAVDTSAITIEHLLTMRSGLTSTSNDRYAPWVLSSDWIDYLLTRPLQARPGEQMHYSTGDTHLLGAVLTHATGRSLLAFAREVLSGPLGFELQPWPTDPQGNYFGGNDMELTVRQLHAFAELYRNHGRYGERQIVPSEWVDASLARRVVSPTGEGRYYGYGWWVATLQGFDVPHAWGYGGQFIMLVPALGLTMVTTSVTTPGPDRSDHANAVYQLLQRVIRESADRPGPRAGPCGADTAA